MALPNEVTLPVAKLVLLVEGEPVAEPDLDADAEGVPLREAAAD